MVLVAITSQKNQLVRRGDTTEAAAQWKGWGTALKPALEPITVARKPLAGTVAANVLDWGTGALNIDGCRVATGDKLGGGATSGHTAAHEGYRRPWMDNRDHLARHAEKCAANVIKAEALGRWPANLILSYNEDEFELRSNVTSEQRKQLLLWMYENT